MWESRPAQPRNSRKDYRRLNNKEQDKAHMTTRSPPVPFGVLGGVFLAFFCAACHFGGPVAFPFWNCKFGCELTLLDNIKIYGNI